MEDGLTMSSSKEADIKNMSTVWLSDWYGESDKYDDMFSFTKMPSHLLPLQSTYSETESSNLDNFSPSFSDSAFFEEFSNNQMDQALEVYSNVAPKEESLLNGVEPFSCDLLEDQLGNINEDLVKVEQSSVSDIKKRPAKKRNLARQKKDPIYCRVCSLVVPTIYDRKRHEAISHGKLVYICDTCHRRHYSKNDLTKHIFASSCSPYNGTHPVSFNSLQTWQRR